MEKSTIIKDPLGNSLAATEVNIKEAREHFNEITLDDGTVLRMKLVATKAYRLHDRWDNQGNPIYIVNSNNVLVVDKVQDHLKQGESSNASTRH